MHAYAVAIGLGDGVERPIADCLSTLGTEFALDASTGWDVHSRDGRLFAAGVHHALDRAAPRRYVDRRPESVTWFDGLPVARRDGVDTRDAAQLGSHWGELDELLDGQFCAARADLEAGTLEVVVDTLGFIPVYVARRDGGALVSNSAWLVAEVLGLDSPDPLGASTFMGLGWPVGDRCLNRDIRVLWSGARHHISHDQVRTDRHFGPPQIARREQRTKPLDEAGLASEMTALTRRAVTGLRRVECALTGGRDSRVALALLRAAGVEPLYFTGGPEDIPDVIIARELAQRFGLNHEVVRHDPNTERRDWTAAAVSFMRQNEGLSSLVQLGDYVELSPQGPPVGVKLGGMGGEIGRAGTGVLTAAATNVPLLDGSLAAQRRLVALKARDPSGIVTGEAHAEVQRYLHDYYDERRREGWRTRELQESFYIFERIGRWASSGARRIAGSDDVFNPLCARPFLDYCLSLTPEQRYLEATHYRLLGRLDTAMRDHRFEYPFRPQVSAYAPVHATARLAAMAAEVVADRLRRRAAEAGSGDPVPDPEYPFPHRWFEGRLAMMRELFDRPQSELWNVVSRPRIEALLAGSEAERARCQEPLLRAATLFWHFHGAPSAAAADRPAQPAA